MLLFRSKCLKRFKLLYCSSTLKRLSKLSSKVLYATVEISNPGDVYPPQELFANQWRHKFCSRPVNWNKTESRMSPWQLFKCNSFMQLHLLLQSSSLYRPDLYRTADPVATSEASSYISFLVITFTHQKYLKGTIMIFFLQGRENVEMGRNILSLCCSDLDFSMFYLRSVFDFMVLSWSCAGTKETK